MKTSSVELTLEDLQDALRSYCQLRGVDPHSVFIVSHSKAIRVELFAGGIVESDEFRHRAIETKIKENT